MFVYIKFIIEKFIHAHFIVVCISYDECIMTWLFDNSESGAPLVYIFIPFVSREGRKPSGRGYQVVWA